MLRKGLSIAFYFCAMALTTLFLGQMYWGAFPRMQVQYWPVCLAVFFSLAAFLWPEASVEEGGRRPYSVFWLRVFALLAVGFSPFVSWLVYLGSYGSASLAGAHWTYFLAMSVAFLICLAFLVALYPMVIRNDWREQLAPGVGLLLGAGRLTIVIPLLAVLAAAGCLLLRDWGEDGMSARSVPFLLWSLATHGEGRQIVVSLAMMTFAAQTLGIIYVLLNNGGTTSPQVVSPKQDLPETEAEMIKSVNQEVSPDDKADEAD